MARVDPDGAAAPEDRAESCWSEAERSAALAEYDIVDTPREAGFDDIAQMVADLCDVPVAFVSLVDRERQFLKAEVGIGRRDVPTHTSFCIHAIRRDDTLIVDDLTADPDFVSHPLVVADPFVRFYAGFLLRTPDGIPIGTLCALDFRPRSLSAQQKRLLELLARQAMTQIELQRTVRERETALSAAQRAEARLRDMVREMAHRLKNSLSMVQAIVSQTFRTMNSLEEGRAALSERLSALARSQDVLVDPAAQNAGIAGVVEAALRPHRTGEGRFDIEGPDLLLDASQALGLSLALHELATNAAKHGALSNEAGRVRIDWTAGADGAFRFTWQEKDGPAILAPPRRAGFGSRLLKRIVAGYFDGRANLAFPAEGVRFELNGTL